jgi:uncharacterized membrane protein YoaK (UPF0700 family)
MLLLVVTVTTGFIDAVSVIGLGNVFVALMTGNVLFLGFALAGLPEFNALHNAAALVAFLVGAAAAGKVAQAFGTSTRRRWLLIAAGVEAVLLAGAGVLARGYDMVLLEPKANFYALVALTAIAMGFRNGTVKKLGIADLSTTVATLTLASLASEAAVGQYKAIGRRLGSVLCLLAGAVVGGLLVVRAGVAPALLSAAIVVVVATLVYAAHPSSAEGVAPAPKPSAPKA